MNVYNPQSIIKVAHRGVPSLVPENTIASYKFALTLNIDMLEIDIHRTRDNKLVIMHDPTTERTSLEKGIIKNLTYKELQKYDIGKWKGEAFIGERIPLFDDVLHLIRNTDIKLLIEVKQPEKYPGIEEQILESLIANDINEQQITIQSFNKKSIQKFKSLNSRIELGVLIKKKDRFISRDSIRKIGEYATFINPNYKIVTKKFVDEAHKVNMKVMPYTINDDETVGKMINLNVDGIITDFPQKIEQWLET